MAGSPSINLEALLAQTSWLRRLAIHLVSDPDKANDLVHETWRIALEKPPKPGVDLRRWAAMVLRNRAKNRYRDEDLQEFHEKSASKSEETPLEDTERRAGIQKQVADAVYRLEEPYRTAITLFYYDDLPADEIARRLRTTPVNARKLLSRGREMLRARLDREFGGREAWCLVFVEMLRRGAAPVAAGAGQAVVLTAAAAALAILSLFVWRSMRSDASARTENQAVPGVIAESTRIPERTSLTPDSNLDHRQGLGTQGHTVDPEREIRGVVIGSGNMPVPGAEIVITGDDSTGFASRDPNAEIARTRIAAIESDARGEFAVEVPPGRPFVLEASAKGYATSVLGYQCAGGRVTVRLGPGSTLEGRVTRESDGRPLAGVRLEALTDEGTFEGARLPIGSGETDEAGQFRFDNLPGSTAFLRLMPRSQGIPTLRDVALEPGGRTLIELPVEDGATVHGRVLDADTDKPIPDAVVFEMWTSNFVHVAADGGYSWTNSSNGSSRQRILEARARGYTPAPHLFDGDLPENFVFRLRRGDTLIGRVLDSESRIVPDAQVIVVSGDPNLSVITEAVRIGGRTDGRGRFELHEAGKGLAFSLLVRHVGSGALVRSYPQTDPGANEVRDLGDLRLPPASTVRGFVVDEQRQPRADWVVSLTAADHTDMQPALVDYLMDRTAKTDDRGRFVFSDLAEGTYRVSTWHSALDPHPNPQSTATVPLVPGEAREDLVLRTPTYEEISGRIVDADGHGIGGINVRATNTLAGETVHIAVTDPSGSFRLQGLRASSYHLETQPSRVLAGRPIFLPRDLRTIAAGKKDLVIRLERGTILHGRFRDAGGRGIGEGSVFGTVPGRSESFNVLTSQDGSFSLPVPLDTSIELKAYPPRNVGDPPSDRVAEGRAITSDPTEVILQLPR